MPGEKRTQRSEKGSAGLTSAKEEWVSTSDSSQETENSGDDNSVPRPRGENGPLQQEERYRPVPARKDVPFSGKSRQKKNRCLAAANQGYPRPMSTQRESTGLKGQKSFQATSRESMESAFRSRRPGTSQSCAWRTRGGRRGPRARRRAQSGT